MELNSEVELKQEDNTLTVHPRSGSRFATAIAGTTRALLANMAQGVSEGFEKKLELVGVGYRAQAQGNKLNLTLGFSHPVVYEMPEGVSVETPSQTEVVVSGVRTNKRSARRPPRFAASVRPSPTRAKVFATPMSA